MHTGIYLVLCLFLNTILDAWELSPQLGAEVSKGTTEGSCQVGE